MLTLFLSSLSKLAEQKKNQDDSQRSKLELFIV